MATKTAEKTAAQTYADRRADVEALLAAIQMELDTDEVEAPNWADVGDMAATQRRLTEVLSTMLIARNEWEEAEAAEHIETYLDELRADRETRAQA